MGIPRLNPRMVALLRDLWQYPEARVRQNAAGSWILHGPASIEGTIVHHDLILQGQFFHWLQQTPTGVTLTLEGTARLFGAQQTMRQVLETQAEDLHRHGADTYGMTWVAANEAVLRVARRYGIRPQNVHNRLPEYSAKSFLSEIARVVCEYRLQTIRAYGTAIAASETAMAFLARVVNFPDDPAWGHEVTRLLTAHGYTKDLNGHFVQEPHAEEAE